MAHTYPERNKIIYLQADNNYTIFHLASGKRYMSSFTLKHYERKTFLNDFIRPNRSFLLNPNYIDHVIEDSSLFSIQMSNGDTIATSKRRKELFKKQLVSVLDKKTTIFSTHK